MIAAACFAGCGEPRGGVVVCIMGQVESYSVTYTMTDAGVQAALAATGMKLPANGGTSNPTASGGIANGACAWSFCNVVFGYQGSKAPVNTPTVEATGL